jgi:hypothetical protein
MTLATRLRDTFPVATKSAINTRLPKMAEIHEGGCLCGAVRYRVTDEPYLAGVCHCTLCKRRTGSAFGVAAYFDASAVQIKSGALKTYEYRSDENNRWLKLEFCLTCGTTVSWTAELFPSARGIAVGTFDDPTWIKPAAHFWTRSAMHWMAFPADVGVFETIPQIDVARFVAENFPPHMHGENCPESVLADLSRLGGCCEQRDLHVLAPASDRVLFVQCFNPKCNKQAIVPKRS